MLKKILSALALLIFVAGITLYGAVCQRRMTPVFTHTEQTAALVCETADESSLTEASASNEDNEDTNASGTLPSDAEASEASSDTSDAGAAPAKAAAEDTSNASVLSSDENSEEAPAVDMAKVTPFPEPKIMYVQTSVNVRKGPDTSFEKIGLVKANEELTILGQYENDGWYHFMYHDEDAFISNLYLADTMVEEPDLSQASAEDAVQPTPEPQPEPAEPTAPEPAPAPQPVTAAGVVFIGDSRCVQMKDAVAGGGCTWICENSKGYNWLIENALPRADNVVGKGTKVVMCLGVNDTRNCNSYAAIMNQKAAEWAARGAKTYYVSVNPVWENPYTSEEQVETFNASIVGQLSGITWIDTHAWLIANGYRLVDGLHYDANTYINIFNVIVGSL